MNTLGGSGSVDVDERPDFPRCLIVNADDFGQCSGINRGIIQAHQEGIVTSASLMVRWPEAGEAAEYGSGNPSLSLGLHLDLGEWIYREQAWVPLYRVVSVDDGAAVADEIDRQLERFVKLVGRNPTHLDSHQHVHRQEPVRSILAAAARVLSVPLRHFHPGIGYCGDFYGQLDPGVSHLESISVESLIGILSHLPRGVTELACHPGFAEGLNSMYAHERSQEVRTLCDPRVRATLASRKIHLRSFHMPPAGEVKLPRSAAEKAFVPTKQNRKGSLL